jgi:hypothetical protein
MSKRLIDVDPITGLQTWHDYDEASDKTFIYECQDIEPLVEHNKVLQNHQGGHAMGKNDYFRKGVKNSWCHIANIDQITQIEWRRKFGVNIFLWGKCDWTTKRMKRLLNDPDYRHLRTGLGRI